MDTGLFVSCWMALIGIVSIAVILTLETFGWIRRVVLIPFWACLASCAATVALAHKGMTMTMIVSVAVWVGVAVLFLVIDCAVYCFRHRPEATRHPGGLP
jgi:hypothetical protein